MPLRPSKVIKRSVVLATAKKTSVSLEDEFWDELWKIAEARRTTLSKLVSEIDDARTAEGAGNLSSSIRLFVLKQVMEGYHVRRPALAQRDAFPDWDQGGTRPGG